MNELEINGYLRLRVKFALSETVVLLRERYHSRWLVHRSCDVPDVEVFSCVHDKELAEAVHESRGACCLLLILSIVEHSAPVDLDDRQLACIIPDSDGRSVFVVINATKADKAIKSESHVILNGQPVVYTYAIDPHENPTRR